MVALPFFMCRPPHATSTTSVFLLKTNADADGRRASLRQRHYRQTKYTENEDSGRTRKSANSPKTSMELAKQERAYLQYGLAILHSLTILNEEGHHLPVLLSLWPPTTPQHGSADVHEFPTSKNWMLAQLPPSRWKGCTMSLCPSSKGGSTHGAEVDRRLQALAKREENKWSRSACGLVAADLRQGST